MATPLTQAEQDAMPHSTSATYPRGVYLTCRCGKTGSATSISGHIGARSRLKEPTLCSEKPAVFRTLEEARDYAAEQKIADAGRLSVRADRAEITLMALQGGRDEEEQQPVRTPAKRGRPVGSRNRTTIDRGTITEQVPLSSTDLVAHVPAKVKIFGEVRPEMFANYELTRQNPAFNFEGSFAEYADMIEDQFWVMYHDIRAGRLVYVSAAA